MYLTFSKARLHPIFIKPSLALTLSLFLFFLTLSFPPHLKMYFCLSKTFFAVFCCHYYPQRNILLHFVAIKVLTLLIHANLKFKVKIGILPIIMNYNHFHNILRLFDVLPNFLFTASETIGNYYL